MDGKASWLMDRKLVGVVIFFSGVVAMVAVVTSPDVVWRIAAVVVAIM